MTRTTLPESWRWIPLREVGDWRGGGTPSKARPDYWKGSIPWVSPKDVKSFRLSSTQDYITELAVEDSATRVVPRDSVLIVTRSGILKHTLPVAVAGQDSAINQDLKALVPADGVDSTYLAYAVRAFAARILDECTKAGTTVQSVETNRLLDFEVPLAPPGEQHQIVDAIETHFTRLDAAAASLDHARANLKRFRASVLQAAVEGRLVPTEAELARREGRSYEPASVLLERTLAERRRRWEEAELEKMRAKGKEPKGDGWKKKYKEPAPPDVEGLPALPEGWCWANLGQAFGVHVGATPSRNKPEYWGGDVAWVSSGEVAFCEISRTKETVTREGLRNTSTKVHPAGTVLLGMIGQGRTRGQAAILRVPACNNQNSAAIRVSEVGLPPEYVFFFLMGQYQKTRALGSGNNQPALNKTRVSTIPMPLPPLAEQRRITEVLDAVMTVVEYLEGQVGSAQRRKRKLRQAILKSAFEGRLYGGPLELRKSAGAPAAGEA